FEIFVDRQTVEQITLLQNKTDLLVAQRRALFRLQMMDGRLVEKIFAIPAVVVHSEDMEQGRFPGAGWSHHRNEFAFRDFDVDIAQNIKKLSVRERITAFEIVKADNKFTQRVVLGLVRAAWCVLRIILC